MARRIGDLVKETLVTTKWYKYWGETPAAMFDVRPANGMTLCHLTMREQGGEGGGCGLGHLLD